MRLALGLLVVTACGDRRSEPARVDPPPAVAPAPIAPPDANDPWTTPEIDGPPEAPNLCTELDRTQLAAAAGASILVLIDSMHMGGQAWNVPAVRICNYGELPKLAAGIGLWISIDGEAKLDTEPSADPTAERLKWRPYVGLGTPAAIGNGTTRTELHTVSHHVGIDVTVGARDLSVSEREQRAIAVMKVVLTQLPADARTWLGTKPELR